MRLVEEHDISSLLLGKRNGRMLVACGKAWVWDSNEQIESLQEDLKQELKTQKISFILLRLYMFVQVSVHVASKCVCVSQRCSKDREWWSGGRRGRLMDIILMGSSSTTIHAIRTGKRVSEDWWWWTWSDCYHSDPWTNEHSRYRPSSPLDIKAIFLFKR